MSTTNDYCIVRDGDRFFGPSLAELLHALEHGTSLALVLEADWLEYQRYEAEGRKVPQVLFELVGMTREDGSGQSWLLDIVIRSGDGDYRGDVEAFCGEGVRQRRTIVNRKIRVYYTTHNVYGRFVQF